MEADNQKESKTSETADDPVLDPVEVEVENLLATVRNLEAAIEAPEASTSSANKNNSAGNAPERSGTKRNYRRRTGHSDEESSADDAVEAETLPTAATESASGSQQQPISDSDDVSLDDLRVNASDDDNIANPSR